MCRPQTRAFPSANAISPPITDPSMSLSVLSVSLALARPPLPLTRPLGLTSTPTRPHIIARTRTVVASEDSDEARRLATAYTAAGAVTALTWSTCAVVALSAHPTLALPLRHNVLTIAQALAPLPLVPAVFGSLSSAATVGWKRMSSATYRRLNLGAAAASAWLAFAAAFAPAFCCGYATYSPALAACAAAVHAAVATLCVGAWARSVPGASPGRILRGLTGSLWQLAPARGDVGGLDDPDVRGGSDVGVNEYALASALFVGFAIVGAVAPFPLATLPHILGRRLSRAASAFTWLAAVTCYCLKDAAERGRSDASTFVALRKGVRRASAIHLLLVAAKLCGADVGGVAGVAYYYKNAMACRNAAAASIVMHAAAVGATL